MNDANICVEILPNLYLSTLKRRVIIQRHFNNIIACLEDTIYIGNPHVEKVDNEFCLNIDDGDGTKFKTLIPTIIKYYEDNKNEKILVHCAFAKSRSPATIMVILIHLGNDLMTARQIIEDKRGKTAISSSFIDAIKEYFGPEKCYGYK